MLLKPPPTKKKKTKKKTKSAGHTFNDKVRAQLWGGFEGWGKTVRERSKNGWGSLRPCVSLGKRRHSWALPKGATGGSAGRGCSVCQARSLKFRSAEYAHIRWNAELSKRGCFRGKSRWVDGGHIASGPSWMPRFHVRRSLVFLAGGESQANICLIMHWWSGLELQAVCHSSICFCLSFYSVWCGF